MVSLREVFFLCQKHGLTIGLPNCEFAGSKIEFFGHLLSTLPLAKHSAAISAFPPLTDKPALQRFQDILNFYRKFLPVAEGVLDPLTNALKGPGKSLDWLPQLDSAFNRTKVLLTSVPELTHPRPDARSSTFNCELLIVYSSVHLFSGQVRPLDSMMTLSKPRIHTSL